MVLSTYFGPMDQPEMGLGEVNKAIILLDARHCELIFCLLTSPKWDLDEVEKAMIPVVE